MIIQVVSHTVSGIYWYYQKRYGYIMHALGYVYELISSPKLHAVRSVGRVTRRD